MKKRIESIHNIFDLPIIVNNKCNSYRSEHFLWIWFSLGVHTTEFCRNNVDFNIYISSWRAASTDIPDPLSLHVSLSFIAFGRSSGLHPVSSHSCCMNVRAGRPAFDWLYAGVQRSTSLTISSLLLQQCPACLVRLAWIVFVIGGRWPYSWRRVGCCCQDLYPYIYIYIYIHKKILEAALHKAAAVWPPTTHHENYTS